MRDSGADSCSASMPAVRSRTRRRPGARAGLGARAAGAPARAGARAAGSGVAGQPDRDCRPRRGRLPCRRSCPRCPPGRALAVSQQPVQLPGPPSAHVPLPVPPPLSPPPPLELELQAAAITAAKPKATYQVLRMASPARGGADGERGRLWPPSRILQSRWHRLVSSGSGPSPLLLLLLLEPKRSAQCSPSTPSASRTDSSRSIASARHGSRTWSHTRPRA